MLPLHEPPSSLFPSINRNALARGHAAFKYVAAQIAMNKSFTESEEQFKQNIWHAILLMSPLNSRNLKREAFFSKPS